jgi:hypothetical protein
MQQEEEYLIQAAVTVRSLNASNIYKMSEFIIKYKNGYINAS